MFRGSYIPRFDKNLRNLEPFYPRFLPPHQILPLSLYCCKVDGGCNQFVGEGSFVDECDLRGKMMEEDHDTLSEVGTWLETHVETGGGNQLLSKAEGEVSEEPPRTPATPETPVGRILRFHTDKHSTPISTNFTTLATPGCQDDSLAGVHSPIHL